MPDIQKKELKSRLNDLVKLVEEDNVEHVLPSNIAATIADRIGNNFDPLNNYEKGGSYTKPGGPGAYTKDGTYTKHDFTKDTTVTKIDDEFTTPIDKDLVLNPGDIEGLQNPLKLSAVLKHPEVRDRLKNVIESELKGL